MLKVDLKVVSVLKTGDAIRLIAHPLVYLFAILKADFALFQLRGAVLTTEIPATAVARHESHPDSIFGFASITLTSATGFGHRYVSTTGCNSSRNVILLWRLLQAVARVRYTVSSMVIKHRWSSLIFKIYMRWFFHIIIPTASLRTVTGLVAG